MTPAEAHKAILQTWITGWADATPFAIDNRRLTQPEPPFAQIDIVNLAGDQVTLGPEGRRRFERTGFIDVLLYGARDKGRGELDALAQTAKEIFEGKRIGAVGQERGITTYAASITEVRNSREFPDLWCLMVRTPFWYHERR